MDSSFAGVLGVFPLNLVRIAGRQAVSKVAVVSVSEVVCTECQESSALSHWAAECRAEVTFMQVSIEQKRR
jgi:hypothetical protein